MIKKLLLLSFILITFNAKSQVFPVDKTTGRIVYTGIEQTEGTADEIFNKSKEWVVENFASINHVLEVDSRTSTQIVGKGNVLLEGEPDTFGFKAALRLYFTFAVNIKDGRYKYEISDLRLGQPTDTDSFQAEDLLLQDFTKPKSKAVGRNSGSYVVTKHYLMNVAKYKADTSILMEHLAASLKKKLSAEVW